MLSLNRCRLFALALVLCGMGSALCAAQTPKPSLPTDTGGYTGELPQFDVMSVKPHKPGEDMMRVRWGGTDYHAENMTVKAMISNVYGVKAWLVFGLPAWAESSHWDIDAKVSAPDMKVMDKLTGEQRRAMIGGILKERFGLVIRQETKVQPVFAMSVMPDGPKFKESPEPPPPPEGEKPKPRGMWRMSPGSLSATSMGMTQIADSLSYFVERTIVDKTGLTGKYDIEMKWTPEDRANATTDNGAGDAPPAIFEALKEQLGLKLTADKAPVATVVVDKITQPEEN
ncbi:TIGR03435 family protein [Terriglobus roseus]|uniref:Soil-associated protein, TIGR03435 family n=1 Tax=Terriglobus roseus TaxID=392734 RepID=A0A1G7PQ10_9BACT|nr:TIGR03435 family protein [Terriglobus roseus]SDF88305.1 soil-associated protein, TIGR03435 family [Terriglobus roseus]